ncbi:LOW QUALITY PROTEIN: uncharacterized protein WM294_004372 [Sarcoramphus papa]
MARPQVIHSGRFMASEPHAEAGAGLKQQEEAGAGPRGSSGSQARAGAGTGAYDFSTVDEDTHQTYGPCSTLSIAASLAKLSECLTLAYSRRIPASPKWKTFKGLKLRRRDKMRLNNAIWRAWHLQCERARRCGRPPHPIPPAPHLPGRGPGYCQVQLSTARLQAWDITDSSKLLIMARNLMNPTGLLLNDSSITLPSPPPGGERSHRSPNVLGGSRACQTWLCRSTALQSAVISCSLLLFLHGSQIWWFCYYYLDAEKRRNPARNFVMLLEAGDRREHCGLQLPWGAVACHCRGRGSASQSSWSGASGAEPTAPSATLRASGGAHRTLAVTSVHVLQAGTMEGKYWKRHIQAVTREYHKWRKTSCTQGNVDVIQPTLGQPHPNFGEDFMDTLDPLSGEWCWGQPVAPLLSPQPGVGHPMSLLVSPLCHACCGAELCCSPILPHSHGTFGGVSTPTWGPCHPLTFPMLSHKPGSAVAPEAAAWKSLPWVVPAPDPVNAAPINPAFCPPHPPIALQPAASSLCYCLKEELLEAKEVLLLALPLELEPLLALMLSVDPLQGCDTPDPTAGVLLMKSSSHPHSGLSPRGAGTWGQARAAAGGRRATAGTPWRSAPSFPPQTWSQRRARSTACPAPRCGGGHRRQSPDCLQTVRRPTLPAADHARRLHIMKPLFESYRVAVSTGSTEDFCRSVVGWLEQHCTLPVLCPAISGSLLQLSKVTSILTQPTRLPEQVLQAVSRLPHANS